MGRVARRRSAKRRRMRPYTTIDGLLRAARRHALQSTAAPSLPLPFRTPQLRPARNAVRIVRHLSGLGAVAAKDLPAGTTLVCEKALAMVLDAQVAEIEEDDTDTNPNKVHYIPTDEVNADSALLILRIASRISEEPSFAAELSMLFPRTEDDLSKLKPWRCAQHLRSLVDAALSTLDDSSPSACRYCKVQRGFVRDGRRVYSHATSPEALLWGIALFRDSSVFNHGEEPNVARWHCGDVVCFRRSAVAAGRGLDGELRGVAFTPRPRGGARRAGPLRLCGRRRGGVADGGRRGPGSTDDALAVGAPGDDRASRGRGVAVRRPLRTDDPEGRRAPERRRRRRRRRGVARGCNSGQWLPPNDEQVASIGVQCAKALAHATGWRRPGGPQGRSRVSPQSRSGPVLDYSRGATNATSVTSGSTAAETRP